MVRKQVFCIFLKYVQVQAVLTTDIQMIWDLFFTQVNPGKASKHNKGKIKKKKKKDVPFLLQYLANANLYLEVKLKA